MLNIIRYGVVSAAVICTLSGSACSDGTKPFVDPSGKDTTLSNLNDPYIPATGTATNTPVRKTAIASPMQYWISVPKGWPGKRTWPVVMTIAGAGRDYEANAKLFAAVRDNENYPFIIVSPVLLTNSGDGPVPRTQAGLDYPSSTWDLIDRVGRCAFDKAGVAAVIAEARNQYSGASRDFLTGFSGGGNPTWAIVLTQPELLRAAAPVASNFSGRCVTKETFTPVSVSNAPERVMLPIRTFFGENDDFRTLGIPQVEAATTLGRANGYTNFSLTLVPNFGHDPMPATVLSYFYSLLSPAER
jgi:predicted esterase